MSTVASERRTEATRISLVLGDQDERTLRQVIGDLDSVENLLIAGYWVDYGTTVRWPGRISNTPRPIRSEIEADVRVLRISYNSPMEVVLEIGPYAASGLAAARGLFYLMSSWQDVRLKAKKTDYEIAALSLLIEKLPSADDVVERPRDEPDLRLAARLMARIRRLVINDQEVAGSSSDGE